MVVTLSRQIARRASKSLDPDSRHGIFDVRDRELGSHQLPPHATNNAGRSFLTDNGILYYTLELILLQSGLANDLLAYT